MFASQMTSRLVYTGIAGLALAAACMAQVEGNGGVADQPVVGLTVAALSADGTTAPTQFADETRVRLQVSRARPVSVDEGFVFSAGGTVRVDVYGADEQQRLGMLESFEAVLDPKDLVAGSVPVDLPRSFDQIDVELEVTVTDGAGRSEVDSLLVPRGTAERLPQRACPHFAELRQRVPDGQLVPSEKLSQSEVGR